MTYDLAMGLFVQAVVIIGAVWGISLKIEGRLTRLETESRSYKENIESLWDHVNRRRVHE